MKRFFEDKTLTTECRRPVSLTRESTERMFVAVLEIDEGSYEVVTLSWNMHHHAALTATRARKRRKRDLAH